MMSNVITCFIKSLKFYKIYKVSTGFPQLTPRNNFNFLNEYNISITDERNHQHTDRVANGVAVYSTCKDLLVYANYCLISERSINLRALFSNSILINRMNCETHERIKGLAQSILSVVVRDKLLPRNHNYSLDLFFCCSFSQNVRRIGFSHFARMCRSLSF